MTTRIHESAPPPLREGEPALSTALDHARLRDRLTEGERASFARHGFLHLPGYFEQDLLLAMCGWVGALEGWPEVPGRWMKYFEHTERDPRQLCRIENFLDDHVDFARLLSHPALMGILGELMGEPAALFKEKINLKLPGGQGFAAHQDAPAFVAFGQRYHITAMIGIDDANPDNGCLEVVRDLGLDSLLPQAADGTIDPAVVETLAFEPLATRAGDLLLFDSYLPHRSGPNRSDRSRRALYVTYNRRSEGERRADYFRDKRDKFPPECERVPGRDYSAGSRIYNLANPIRG